MEADVLVSRITELLGEIPVHEAVRADGTYFWSYRDDAVEQGTLYADPAIAPVVVEAIGAGMPIYGSRAELAARYTTEAAPVLEKVRDAINTLAQEAGTPDSIDRVSVSAQVLNTLDTVIEDRGALSPEPVAWLALGASLTPIRDEMWARMTRTNAEAHAEIWRLVANQVVDEASVAPYTLCAFAHWLHGDGAQALIALERAQDIDPNYSMASLIGTVLENSVSPETWDGFDPAGIA